MPPAKTVKRTKAPTVSFEVTIGPPKLTRFERARIVGARSLQLAMGAPAFVSLEGVYRGPIQTAMLELEADAGRLEPRPVLLLLDRRADVFLARRSGIKGWLVRPLDPIRLRRAAAALLSGGTWHDDSYLPSPVAVPVN
ncbi:MAG: DNA-directed RNA polymerase subunit K [Nitrososphaerota archaeon]|nr:DNA-directed RNA polymerase subunit K [Nitrososphaerota archaeon]